MEQAVLCTCAEVDPGLALPVTGSRVSSCHHSPVFVSDRSSGSLRAECHWTTHSHHSTGWWWAEILEGSKSHHILPETARVLLPLKMPRHCLCRLVCRLPLTCCALLSSLTSHLNSSLGLARPVCHLLAAPARPAPGHSLSSVFLCPDHLPWMEWARGEHITFFPSSLGTQLLCHTVFSRPSPG